MKGSGTVFIARLMLVILFFVLINSLYQGFITRPAELDSLYYHIPIAKSYLDGRIFSSPDSPILHRFFPGASEGILSLFILFHLPLNTYNVLALACLFFACVWLGVNSGLKKGEAVVFAGAVSLLNGIVRWLNVQTVDTWMAVWYTGALALLLKPVARSRYALTLGAFLGMMVGTKYSGPGLSVFLLIAFVPGLFKKWKLYHYFLAVLPFLVLGGFWYLRNLIVRGNPLYPLAFFGFPGVSGWALEEPVWKAIADKPASFGSAVVSEFFLWPIFIVSSLFISVYDYAHKKRVSWSVAILQILSLLNLAIYLFLPNGQGYTVHVSNLRYSYPVLIPGILAVFLLARERKQIDIVMITAILQLFFSLQFAYHPKLLFIFVPLALFVWKKSDRWLQV